MPTSSRNMAVATDRFMGIVLLSFEHRRVAVNLLGLGCARPRRCRLVRVDDEDKDRDLSN
jgi:hypothetical protein